MLASARTFQARLKVSRKNEHVQCRGSRRLHWCIFPIGLVLSVGCIGSYWRPQRPVPPGFYVSPTGSAKPNGSHRYPWDLQTALAHPAEVKAGDTIWLLGGTYRGTFVSSLRGAPDAAIKVQAFPGERVTIDTFDAVAGNSRNLEIVGDDTEYRDFEVMCSDPSSRTTRQPGSHPPDINRGQIEVKGSRNKFINLVVHDLNKGFGFWASGEGGEIHGCLIFNNGWQGPDRVHGPGIYVQNQYGTKTIANNVIFNQYGRGIQAYGSSSSHLANLSIEGNTIFKCGDNAANKDTLCDILIGAGAPAKQITVTENRSYRPNQQGFIRLGWGPVNHDIALSNNYLVGYVGFLREWRDVSFTGNVFLAGDHPVIRLPNPEESTFVDQRWDRNQYQSTREQPFDVGGEGFTWLGWQNRTGFDRHSEFTANLPSGQRVFVEPNEYEPGRANITVYNWSLSPGVKVDLSGVLEKGETYELRRAVDYFGEAVASGMFDGRAVEIPLSSSVCPRPIGCEDAETAELPAEFGVFVVQRVIK